MVNPIGKATWGWIRLARKGSMAMMVMMTVVMMVMMVMMTVVMRTDV